MLTAVISSKENKISKVFLNQTFHFYAVNLKIQFL